MPPAKQSPAMTTGLCFASPVFVRPPAILAGAARVEVSWQVPACHARGQQWLLYARGATNLLQLVTPLSHEVASGAPGTANLTYR